MMNEELKKQLRNRGICVIIPTYNNDTTIKTVVEKSLLYCDDVIVVTDGCTDRTTDILEAIDGITIVSYPQNRGKGYALKMGFRKALEMGFSYAITLDGDGQHYPEDIPLFLKANREHPKSLIIGSRQLEGVDRSKGSSFANKFSNFWFYVQTGRALPDTQTGYRLYPLHRLHIKPEVRELISKGTTLRTVDTLQLSTTNNQGLGVLLIGFQEEWDVLWIVLPIPIQGDSIGESHL